MFQLTLHVSYFLPNLLIFVVYYLIDLAGTFHNYWSKGNLDSNLRVINETDNELTVARLTLLNCISKVIKLGLDILAIKPLEKM